MIISNIRWQERFSSYKKALTQLTIAVQLSSERELSQLEKQGLIHTFKVTHELAWKVMRDFLLKQENLEIRGSRDAVRESFKVGLIEDHDPWIAMIENRKLISHSYNEEISDRIYTNIANHFIVPLQEFKTKIQLLIDQK